jgi:hypothetical protein
MRKGDVCDDAEIVKCMEEYDERELAWACAHCPKLKNEEIHPYTRKLLDFRMLQKAGFPLEADMLTYEEWLDLGRVNGMLETPKL